jgi:type IV secretion system protein TrbD
MHYDDSPLREADVRRSLNRPNHIAGAERELVLITALVTLALVMVAMNIVATTVGVFLWFISIVLLRIMAKADPQMSRVFIRSQRYRSFYRAYSTPFRKD